MATSDLAPRRLDDGTPYISKSQLKKLLTCPRRYKHQYVDGIPDPIGTAGWVGICTHDAVALAREHYRDTGNRPNPDDVADGARALLHASLQHETLPDKDRSNLADEREDALYDAERLARILIQDTYDKELEPVLLEERIEVGIMDNLAFVGYVDEVCIAPGDEVWLVDYKTTGRSPSYGQASRTHALELSLYALGLDLMDRRPDRAFVAYAVKNKTEKTVWSEVQVTDQTLAWARTVLASAHGQIQSGHLPPNPLGAGFLCHEDRCPYWEMCPGGASPEVTPP